jgi:transposase-like protein
MFWSSNLLERANEEIKCRKRMFDLFSSDAAITRMVGSMLVEQFEY